MSTKSAQEWSFEHFYYMDLANAAIHKAKVKFSPLTFEIAAELDAWIDRVNKETRSMVNEVMSHVGQYELDVGR